MESFEENSVTRAAYSFKYAVVVRHGGSMFSTLAVVGIPSSSAGNKTMLKIVEALDSSGVLRSFERPYPVVSVRDDNMVSIQVLNQ